MPYPDEEYVCSSNNAFITEELGYDMDGMHDEYIGLFSALTEEQRSIFDEIMAAGNKEKGGLFFVYEYGGTGKTYLWKTLSSKIRSKGKIFLDVASSGIASLLLSGDRTAHSRFIIPINLIEDSMFSIKEDSDVCQLLKKTPLIIWDEVPMIHKHAFEALDRILQDILNSSNRTTSEETFDGKVIIFGGDIRPILSVITCGSRQDVVSTSLSSSYIWPKCKHLTLNKNTRLTSCSDVNGIEQRRIFSKWLLYIGEGKIGGSNDGEALIEIPEDLLILDSLNPVSDLIEFVYSSILQNYTNYQFFQERAILAPKNKQFNK